MEKLPKTLTYAAAVLLRTRELTNPTQSCHIGFRFTYSPTLGPPGSPMAPNNKASSSFPLTRCLLSLYKTAIILTC